MHCLIQLGVVQNTLAGKTSLKQALYLQQSLVYPELRHLNWLGYQTDIATTKYTKKKKKKKHQAKKQKWLLGTDCLTLPNYCNFFKGSSNCLAVLRARSDNDKADHLPANTKVWEKASVPFFFHIYPNWSFSADLVLPKPQKKGGGGKVKPCPFSWVAHLPARQLPWPRITEWKLFFTKYWTNKYSLQARQQIQSFFLFWLLNLDSNRRPKFSSRSA